MSNFKLWFKQNSPEILLGVNVVGSAGAVILGSVATTKVAGIVNPKMELIGEEKKLIEKLSKAEQVSDEEIKKHKSIIKKTYFKMGAKLFLNYLPCILSYSASTVAAFGSHKIMKGRQIALAAALSTCEAGYAAYRSRVREKLGEEAEKALFEGREEKEVKVKDEKGKEKIEKSYDLKNLHTDCDFGVVWGDGNYDYDHEHPGLNISHLMQAEQTMNDILRSRGYLFLHEVYEQLGYTNGMLGERKLQAAHVLGWIYDPEDKERDSFVSFGIHDSKGVLTPEAKRLQQGTENAIWLEFNVDGDILTGDKGKRTFMKTAVKKG